MTILIGLIGSFTAGLFAWYVLHTRGAGLLLSIGFTMIILLVRRHTAGPTQTRRR